MSKILDMKKQKNLTSSSSILKWNGNECRLTIRSDVLLSRGFNWSYLLHKIWFLHVFEFSRLLLFSHFPGFQSILQLLRKAVLGFPEDETFWSNTTAFPSQLGLHTSEILIRYFWFQKLGIGGTLMILWVTTSELEGKPISPWEMKV